MSLVPHSVKISFTLGLILLSSFTSIISASTNLVINGDFESELGDEWEKYYGKAGDSTIERVINGDKDGDYEARVYKYSWNAAYIRQYIPITDIDSILSFKVKMDGYSSIQDLNGWYSCPALDVVYLNESGDMIGKTRVTKFWGTCDEKVDCCSSAEINGIYRHRMEYTGSDWETFSFNLKDEIDNYFFQYFTPEDVEEILMYAHVWVSYNGNAWGEVYVDDIEFMVVEDTTTSVPITTTSTTISTSTSSTTSTTSTSTTTSTSSAISTISSTTSTVSTSSTTSVRAVSTVIENRTTTTLSKDLNKCPNDKMLVDVKIDTNDPLSEFLLGKRTFCLGAKETGKAKLLFNGPSGIFSILDTYLILEKGKEGKKELLLSSLNATYKDFEIYFGDEGLYDLTLEYSYLDSKGKINSCSKQLNGYNVYPPDVISDMKLDSLGKLGIILGSLFGSGGMVALFIFLDKRKKSKEI